MRFAVLLPMAALAACAQVVPETPPEAPEDRAALAAEIEKAVAAMLPEITVSQYARHYARTDDGHVRAIYLRQCTDDWATCAGAEANWTTADRLPSGPSDGGCRVVRVEYDPAHKALVTAICNGEA